MQRVGGQVVRGELLLEAEQVDLARLGVRVRARARVGVRVGASWLR